MGEFKEESKTTSPPKALRAPARSLGEYSQAVIRIQEGGLVTIGWNLRLSGAVVEHDRKRPRRKAPKLHNWGTLPAYLRDNEFITSGYRADWSFFESLKSLFLLHNETGNIWSHLIGFLFFVHLTIHVATSPPSPQALDSVWETVHSMNAQIEQGVHSLHSSLKLRVENLEVAVQHSFHSLHRSLETSGAAVKSHLKEHLEVARESVHDKVDVLRRNLDQSLESLSEGLQNFGKNSELSGTLTAVKENLENSFGGLQESLHHVQEVVSGNLDAVRGTVFDKMGSSFKKLQDSLQRCKDALGFSAEGKDTDDSAYCPLIQGSYESTIPRWPIYIFMLGAMSCMLISSICHLFGCCSEHTAEWIWRVDYVGIAFLIVTSFFPPLYYCFLCHPGWIKMYLTTITILGLVTMCVSCLADFKAVEYRLLRAKLFSGLGCSGAIPLIHQLFINYDVGAVRHAAVYMILMGATYLFGAFLFASRIPERYYPGTFDLIFHSHQLFHLAVVGGAFFHFQGAMVLLNWRETTGGCPANF